MADWQWDPSLYRGSADYYTRGRIPYPSALADALYAAHPFAPSARLLDIGCGPGSLTLLLADRFDRAVGVDADPDMIAAAAALATRAGRTNTGWRCLRAEQLPADLGHFDLITFAQSLHWMDRPKVLHTARSMLTPGGICAHVHATTHEGVPPTTPAEHPTPPHPDIKNLITAYLGPIRRAGNGLLPSGTASGEDEIYRAAGFTRIHRFEIPGRTVTRTTDDLVAAVFSLSGSTPHLLGDNRTRFEADLRHLLREAAPTGLFSEHTREIAVDLWKP
ncbi:class I SAM-dependent methyltransferase [Nocardia sp. alder85J]|uniref:class I SAM-dependent methyltransferase n=1 Tax=Nocardia sp. alder85J TaxID=2862949 RepID=UPI001CD768F3|nr:class I SAM-dependent methyltransferase [Nocardia sp. alder85J]MCX4094745.1 class I SAM-dependent methyltransferase [Nocardia sp. alder85J]